MHQSRQMDHLKDHADPDMLWRNGAESTRRQEHQGRPDPFPMRLRRVGDVRLDGRIELRSLLGDLRCHLGERFFDKREDLPYITDVAGFDLVFRVWEITHERTIYGETV